MLTSNGGGGGGGGGIRTPLEFNEPWKRDGRNTRAGVCMSRACHETRFPARRATLARTSALYLHSSHSSYLRSILDFCFINRCFVDEIGPLCSSFLFFVQAARVDVYPRLEEGINAFLSLSLPAHFPWRARSTSAPRIDLQFNDFPEFAINDDSPGPPRASPAIGKINTNTFSRAYDLFLGGYLHREVGLLRTTIYRRSSSRCPSSRRIDQEYRLLSPEATPIGFLSLDFFLSLSHDALNVETYRLISSMICIPSELRATPFRPFEGNVILKDRRSASNSLIELA